ncbi:MAG TPA: hypothetical protein VF515_00390, partial [Candidatus Binatia bacterium]
MLAISSPTAAQAQVDVTITADNAYSFGYGTASGILPGNLLGNVENCTSGDITNCSGPEVYP